MKLNWGIGITVIIILFLGWIFFLVFKASNQRIDLVTEEYYPKELKYQEIIEKSANYKALGANLTIAQNENNICIEFPDSLFTDSITGSVHLYRPSDKFLDQQYRLALLQEKTFCFNRNKLQPGKYEIIVEWKYLDKGYFLKENVFIR